MSGHYPRRHEHGESTFRCRWCGKEMKYDVGWYLYRGYCSTACYSADFFPVSICTTIILGYITWLLIDFLSQIHFPELYTGLIVMTEFMVLATATSIGCIVIGYRARHAHPKNPHKTHYDPRMVE